MKHWHFEKKNVNFFHWYPLKILALIWANIVSWQKSACLSIRFKNAKNPFISLPWLRQKCLKKCHCGILISSSHVQYIKQVIVCLHFVYLVVTLFWVLAIFKCFIYALSSRYPPRAFDHVTKYPSAETEWFFPFFKPYFHYDKYSFKI